MFSVTGKAFYNNFLILAILKLGVSIIVFWWYLSCRYFVLWVDNNRFVLWTGFLM